MELLRSVSSCLRVGAEFCSVRADLLEAAYMLAVGLRFCRRDIFVL